MIKLALIGDASISHYAVADRLWELMSVLTDTNINFSTIPLATSEKVVDFFDSFRHDRSYMGFNVAIPWKNVLADRVDSIEPLLQLPLINTVYKTSDGTIVGANTDPLAAQKAIEAHHNLYKCSSVLVIGTDKSGLAIAQHFADNLNKTTYIYDQTMSQSSAHKKADTIYLSSHNEMTERTYDLIINTTPFGRHSTDERIDTFMSPLDLDILRKVSHRQTIVQETNYLPNNTLLLQMAQHLGLQVITGDLMLVYRAAESFKRYFGVSLDQSIIEMLINEIGVYIAEREAMILDGGLRS